MSQQHAGEMLPRSTEFSGGALQGSLQASRGEDLRIEEPVFSGNYPAFHFRATLAGMLGPTLIRHQVVQVR